jgi:hypothetical protein
MNDQTIADASKTIVDLLKAELADIAAQIGLASPKTPGNNILTLFLYKVLPNPCLRNEDRRVGPPDANGRVIERPAPLTLDLYYLLTAHPLAGQVPNLLEAHRALSRAMRVLHEHGILRGSLLHSDTNQGFTKDSILRITFNPISMEDMTRIWSVFPDTPYEISVTYLVTPVEIELTAPPATAPVVDQIHDTGHLDSSLVTTGA